MTYCLEWRLVGRANRPLDNGEIDREFSDRPSALQALHAFLATFALRGRNEAEGYWWGRRSTDADIEVQVVLRHPVLPASCPSRQPKLVAGQEASPVLLSKLANQNGGENDIRRTEPALQGRRRSQWPDCDQAETPWRVARRSGPVGRASQVRAPALPG